SDGAHHRLRRAFQQIGEPYKKPALAQANGVIDVREGKKLYFQLRRCCRRPQLAMFFMKDFQQSLTHSEPRLAWDDSREALAELDLQRLTPTCCRFASTLISFYAWPPLPGRPKACDDPPPKYRAYRGRWSEQTR